MQFQETIEAVGEVIDAVGVAAIVVGIVASTVIAVCRLVSREPDVYRQFRRFLGRSILLGLEILVAADIIKTVAVTPTLESVAVLAAIVVIRTFLSWSLELEISGRWPWQKPAAPRAATAQSGEA
ncbi:DUF1622 domain-containing protein [Dietzia sp. ANT_WB102]|uniref:DUF1622 domain-containing protein n=1 Tax=Dietzia sp. ANT_WB102 TaxID=2597345 RepID=UPI0011EF0D67|nr:DUF1622 domain-containing protein [Dietzia sp. ANT_WB102]KAA0919263.1 DUF1622 domain-containing protein [Dietzia sp. ANT_WB102]